MNSPRRRTNRTASAKESAPATTRAEYSPRLWPAARAGVMPRSASAAAAATLAVRTAGWVVAVRASASSGPSKHSAEREYSERGVRLRPHRGGGGRRGGEILAHADGLRALTGEQEDRAHGRPTSAGGQRPT